MKKSVSGILVVLMALFLVAGLSAQRANQLAPRPTLTGVLNVSANVPNFIVIINGKNYQSDRIELPNGVYTVIVRAAGYNDFIARDVRIAGNSARLNAILTPSAPPPPQRQVNASLNILSNVPNAQVFVNNNQMGTSGMTFSLQPGMYQIRVTAPGYSDFVTAIQLVGNQSINAVLNPILFNLSVNANVPGAQVAINNNPTGTVGGVFALQAGTYQVKISAPGYIDYLTTVQLSGNQSLNAVLSPVNFNLTINSNVRNAQVYINNNAAGPADKIFSLPGGTYQIRVSAPGYQDFLTTVQVGGNQVLPVQMMAAPGNLIIKAPRGIPVLVSVDGRPAKLERDDESLPLTPGTHVIRLTYGNLTAETTIVMNPGQNIELVPQLAIQVK